MSLASARRDKEEKVKKPKEDDEMKAALKAGTWKEVKDPSNGKTYYYNPITKKTTWDLKKELKKQKEAAAVAASPPPAAPTATATVPGPSTLKKVQQPTAAAAVVEPAAAEATIVDTRNTTAGNSASAPQQRGQPAAAAATTSSPASSSILNSTSGAIQQGGGSHASSAGTGASPAAGYQGAGGGTTPTGLPLQKQMPAVVTDSMQQLLDENVQMRQLLASGSSGQVALDFQAKYDAVLRTNQALTVQTERMKHEHDAMARALTDANMKIHELELNSNTSTAGVQERTKDEEIRLTLTHLREQNRALVTQSSELSTLLARGLNENAIAAAGLRAHALGGANLSAGGGNVGVGASSAADTGASLLTRFLDSSVRQVLCPTCMLSVSQMRDRMLNPSQTNAGMRVGGRPPAGQHHLLGEEATPMYTQVSELTTPPPTFHYSAQPPHQLGAQPSAPGVGFGTQYQYGVAPAVGGGGAPGIGSSRGPSSTMGGPSSTMGGPSSTMGGDSGTSPYGSVGGVNAAGGGGQSVKPHEVPGVMYNGFIVKNPRGRM